MNLPTIAKSSPLRKIALWGAALFALVGLLGFLVAPHFVKSAMEKALGEKLQRSVAIESLAINPYALSATVKGFHLKEKNGAENAVAFDELYVNVEAESLLRMAPVVGKLRLSGLQVRLVRNADKRYNFSDILDALMSQPDSGPTPPFSLNNIQISGGRIDFDDQPQGKQHVLSDIRLDVPFVSNLPAYVDIFVQPAFAAKLNGTPLALSGKALPFKAARQAAVELDFADFDLTRYLDYSPVPLNFKLPSGLLDSKLAVTFSQAPQQPVALLVAGTIGLKKLEMTDSRGQALLKWPALQIAIHSFDVFNNKLALDSVVLDHPEISLRRDARGALNLLALQPPAGKPAAPPQPSTPAPAAVAKPAPAFDFSVTEAKLIDGRVDFADAQPRQPFRTRVEAINLTVRKLANHGQEPASIDLALQTAGGAHLAHHGQLTLAPLAAQGELNLDALPLKDYAAYYAPLIAFAVEGGKLDAAAKYAFALEGNKPQLTVSDATVRLADLKLRQLQDRQPFFSLARLDLKGIALDLGRRTLSVGELNTQGGKLLALRGADGVFNLTRLMPAGDAPASPASANAASATKAPTAAPAWNVQLQKLALNGYGVRVEDRKVAGSLPFVAEAIALSADHLATQPGKGGKSNLRFSAAVGKRGKLELSGTLQPAPLQAQLALDVRSIDLVPLQAYFTDNFNVTLTRGAVSTRGKLQADLGTSGKLKASYRGDATLGDFALIDKLNSADLLKWKSFYFSGIDVDLDPLRIVVGDIALSDFYTRLILSAAGKLNLTQLVRNTEPATPAPPASTPTNVPTSTQTSAPTSTPVAAAKPATAPNIKIGRVTLQGGNVYFSDFFVKPNYNADMVNLGGSVAGLSSEPGTTASVDLRGDLNGAPLEISGTVNPLASEIALDLKAGVRGMELGPLSPYSGKYAGYAIEKGKLTVDLRYFIEKQQLKAENKLFLDQLTFGDKVDSPEATKMPVLLAVALLKNRNGEIDINLPISGSLDDPQFSVGGIVVQVIVNLVVKAVTSPFALLGSLFGGGEELGYLEFAPGHAAITTAGEARLKALAKALADRPGLKLDIAGRVDPAADQEGLRHAQMERKIKAQKLKETLKQGEDAGSVDEVALTPNEYAKYLKLAYKDESFAKPRNLVGLTKDLPPEEMEKLMVTNAQVGDNELRTLANRRAQAAKDWLVKIGQVPAERVFTTAPHLNADGLKDSGKASRVDFALK